MNERRDVAVQASVTSPTPAENGSTLGPQPGPQAAAQQSPAAGQGQGHQPPQEASSPQPQPHPQPEPQDEGAAMLGRIAAVHADVDSLAARVSLQLRCEFVNCEAAMQAA